MNEQKVLINYVNSDTIRSIGLGPTLMKMAFLLVFLRLARRRARQPPTEESDR